MKYISIIKAEIESISPLFISDGEDVLLDEESKMAYIPATTIGGAFRAYLEFLGEDSDILFGNSGNVSEKSSIYIGDSFAPYRGFERRDGVAIDNATGSSKLGAKMESLYLKKGLKFPLDFKIQGNKEDISIQRNLIYRALKGLNNSYIRLGGNKSSGLGRFKVTNIEGLDFNFEDINQWIKYLNRDYKDLVNITQEVLSKEGEDKFVEFRLNGALTTPLLIGASEYLEADDVDNRSIKSDGEYIIPGSSFKGILRSRVESIAHHFNNLSLARELFGDGAEASKMSRIFVSESIIEKPPMDEMEYNRIQIDKFTGGVRNAGLMNESPIYGDVEFRLIYKLSGNRQIDSYAIGIIALAFRDLGTENLSLGSGFNIGRGRYKGDKMTIQLGEEKIEIDLAEKKISNENRLNEYVNSVKNFRYEEGENGE